MHFRCDYYKKKKMEEEEEDEERKFNILIAFLTF
jgi:hypothetical protein